jgi:hypothetical protein
MEQMVAFNTHTKGNILDLVLTNIPDRISDVRDEGRLGQSDHTMLVVEVSVNAAAAPTNTAQRPDWSRADWNKARQQHRDRAWKSEIGGHPIRRYSSCLSGAFLHPVMGRLVFINQFNYVLEHFLLPRFAVV